MTSDSARKSDIRAYMAAHGVGYSEAQRHLKIRATPGPERDAFFSEFVYGPHPHALIVTGTHGGVGTSTLGDRLAERSIMLGQKADFTIWEGPIRGSAVLPANAKSPFITRVLLIEPRKASAVGAVRLIRAEPEARFYVVANVRAGESRFTDEDLSEFFAEGATYLGSVDLADAADAAVLDAILRLTEQRIRAIDRSLMRKVVPSEKDLWEYRSVGSDVVTAPDGRIDEQTALDLGGVLMDFPAPDGQPLSLDPLLFPTDGDAPGEARVLPYPQMALGQKIRFTDDRQVWIVRRVSEDGRYVVLTNGKSYSIIDFAEGVRGPDNSYGTGYTTDETIAESLDKLVAGDTRLSPRHWTWLRYADSQSDARTAAMLDELRASVEAVYLANPQRHNGVYMAPPSLWVSERLPYAAPYDVRFQPEDDDLLIGAGPHDSVVRWNPERDAHLLVTGSQNSGKTAALATVLISALANGFEVSVIESSSRLAFMRSRAVDYVGSANEPRVATDLLRMALATLSDVLGEIDLRYEQMLKEGVSLSSKLASPPSRVLLAIDDLRHLVEPDIYPAFVIVDSEVLAERQARADLKAKIYAAVTRIVRTGRAAGVHAVVTVRDLRSSPVAFKHNFQARLITGVIADPDWQTRLGNPEHPVPITTPAGEGRAVFESSGPSTEVQVWWADGNQTLTSVLRRRKR